MCILSNMYMYIYICIYTCYLYVYIYICKHVIIFHDLSKGNAVHTSTEWEAPPCRQIPTCSSMPDAQACTLNGDANGSCHGSCG